MNGKYIVRNTTQNIKNLIAGKTEYIVNNGSRIEYIQKETVDGILEDVAKVPLTEQVNRKIIATIMAISVIINMGLICFILIKGVK